MASSDRQIDKPQRGRPERAELPDVNINTGAQSITTERAWAELPDVNINTSAKSMNTEGASLKPHHKIHVDTAAVRIEKSEPQIHGRTYDLSRERFLPLSEEKW